MAQLKKTLGTIKILLLTALAGYLGFSLIALWIDMRTDNYMGSAIVMLAALYIVPISTLLLFLIIFLRGFKPGRMNLTLGDYAWLSFVTHIALFSLVYAAVMLPFNKWVSSEMSLAYAFTIIGSLSVMYLLLIIMFHKLYLAVIKQKKISAKKVWWLTIIIIIFAFAANLMTTRASAYDVCHKLKAGDMESGLQNRLQSYRLRESPAYDPDTDNYSYSLENGEYFILSPGVYCTVTTVDKIIKSVSITSDSL